MREKAKFLIFCMIFAVKSAQCQNQSAPLLLKALHPSSKKVGNKQITQQVYEHYLFFNSCFSSPKRIIPKAYYATQMGFFCKQELKMEKNFKVPLKFRLGSVLETDRLEGKPNTKFSQ
jgi:hypothetical protein